MNNERISITVFSVTKQVREVAEAKVSFLSILVKNQMSKRGISLLGCVYVGGGKLEGNEEGTREEVGKEEKEFSTWIRGRAIYWCPFYSSSVGGDY